MVVVVVLMRIVAATARRFLSLLNPAALGGLTPLILDGVRFYNINANKA
jgi:hypothetical protein